MLRVRGTLLLSMDEDGAAALAVAQTAKLWALRAAASLARLWRDHGKLIGARDVLAPIYGWFTKASTRQSSKTPRRCSISWGDAVHSREGHHGKPPGLECGGRPWKGGDRKERTCCITATQTSSANVTYYYNNMTHDTHQDRVRRPFAHLCGGAANLHRQQTRIPISLISTPTVCSKIALTTFAAATI
jgi:hypothetical protein